MPLTKKELALILAERFNVTQVSARNIVQGTFDAIIDVLKADGRMELRDFGVFEVKERRSRHARNPRTGQPVEVPVRRIVKFRPGREMAERIARDSRLPDHPSSAPPPPPTPTP
ncbi:MAG: HU family DNA-binding protein, partial [Planctomycetes bacterium]|nr:HU family DNA-binding protein [Planctomycetota bacterium]